MLEIIAQTPEDAAAAESGGATQIDLKANFAEGGTTPTAGMVVSVCASVKIDVLVMVRPRVDRMVFTPTDIRIMCEDITLARQRGADGFLLGALTENREIDAEAILAFKEAAQEKPLHFHLGWELTNDPQASLEKLIELGIKSARTTGGQGLSGKAENGVDMIRRYQQIASGRIDLLLAGGVSPENASRLIQLTGVANLHSGTPVRTPLHPSAAVDLAKVKALRKAQDAGIKKLQMV